jgi:hypothetical protein
MNPPLLIFHLETLPKPPENLPKPPENLQKHPETSMKPSENFKLAGNYIYGNANVVTGPQFLA